MNKPANLFSIRDPNDSDQYIIIKATPVRGLRAAWRVLWGKHVGTVDRTTQLTPEAMQRTLKEVWAVPLAGDRTVLNFIESLPPSKQVSIPLRRRPSAPEASADE